MNGILSTHDVPNSDVDEDDEPEPPPKKKAAKKTKVKPEPEEGEELDDVDDDDEEEKPAPKKPRGGTKGKPAPESDAAPEYFGDLAEANDLTMVEKEKRITMKGEGRGNVATLLLKKGGWLLVLNGGDVDDYAGTVALASWNDQPSIDAESKKAEALLKKHIKVMV